MLKSSYSEQFTETFQPKLDLWQKTFWRIGGLQMLQTLLFKAI